MTNLEQKAIDEYPLNIYGEHLSKVKRSAFVKGYSKALKELQKEIEIQKKHAEESYIPGEDNNYWYGKVILCNELISILNELKINKKK